MKVQSSVMLYSQVHMQSSASHVRVQSSTSACKYMCSAFSTDAVRCSVVKCSAVSACAAKCKQVQVQSSVMLYSQVQVLCSQVQVQSSASHVRVQSSTSAVL